MQIIIFLFLSALVSIKAEEIEEIQNKGINQITYQCEKSDLLILYNQSMARGNVQFIKMHCSSPFVCNKLQTCVTTVEPSCSAKSQYLAGVQELEDKSLVSTCCQMTPPLEEEEPCYDIDILDETLYGKRSQVAMVAPDSDIMSALHPRSARRIANAGESLPNMQTTPVAIELKPELMLIRLPYRKPAVELIKSIEKISNGYRVKVCTPQCDEPPTSQPMESQQQRSDEKEEVAPIDKGLDFNHI